MMQRCAKCHQKFKWSQLFQSLWLAFRHVKCRNCGTLHKVANASRLLATLLLLVPVIYISVFMQNLKGLELLWPIIVVIGVASVSFPFILKYEKVDTNFGNR